MLSEKIALLRRRFGWSQEELAGQLGVSRQSVSKWESNASQPDLDKVIAMSQLFGVSTDYLLLDALDDLGPAPAAPDVELPPEIELPTEAEEQVEEVVLEPQVRRVGETGLRVLSPGEANQFLENRRQCAPRIALGVGLITASPGAVVALQGVGHTYRSLRSLCTGVGVMGMMAMIALAIYLFITTGMRMHRYSAIDAEPFELTRAMEESVRRQRMAYKPEFSHDIAMGVALCATCWLPVTMAGITGMGVFVILVCVAALLVMIGGGVFLFVRDGMIMDSYKHLLQEGPHSVKRKKRRSAISRIGKSISEKLG